MAVMGALSSYPLMLAGRVMIGVTEGPQFGTAIATVKRWYVPREQALGNAIWTIGSPLGSAIGFPLVIFLVAQLRLARLVLCARRAERADRAADHLVLPARPAARRKHEPGARRPRTSISFGDAMMIVDHAIRASGC